MIKGDTSSEGSGNDNFAVIESLTKTFHSIDLVNWTDDVDFQANTKGEGKGGAGTGGAAALQSYRPYGDTLMIPRAKHQHPPINTNSAAAAERGEASNREHQLLDYLDGSRVSQLHCMSSMSPF